MTTRDLLSGPITLSAAIAKSRDVLHALQYPHQKGEFYDCMESHRPLLCDIVAHHLRTKSSDVTVSPQEYWRHGSFNLCIPVHIDPSARPTVPQFVMLRFPLPYRVGEAQNPGNSDEKLNSEAATYAWLREYCPSVPIPQLHGFGLSTNLRVCAPVYIYMLFYHLQQVLSLRTLIIFPGGRACFSELAAIS